MMTVKKLMDELSYWMHIRIAEDIYKCKENRFEYLPLVNKYLKKVPIEDHGLIPMLVYNELKLESKLPIVFQKTQYWLLYCHLIKFKNKLFYTLHNIFKKQNL